MGKRSSPALHIEIPQRLNFNHMSKCRVRLVRKRKLRFPKKNSSKKPKIAIPDKMAGGSPIPSPIESEDSLEKELNRVRKEFSQFNKDLDEISSTVEKLVQGAPDWLKGIEEIKKKQDNVEECITAAQEKIFENETRLGQLQTLQYEANDDINNDLKKIQEQLFELLEKHRSARHNADILDDNQTKTTEQLDLMLQAIHEYARLIQEASSTIKQFGDLPTPIKYESLDLSPFRRGEGSSSYFEEHIYRASRATTPISSVNTSRSTSPIFFSSSGLSSPIAPSTSSSDPSSPLSPTGPPLQISQPIYPLPYYQLRHQQLLLLGMRRAAVGLKFLLYAKQLTDLKKGHPELNRDLDVDLFWDSQDEYMVSNYTTCTKTATFNSKDSDSSSDSDSNSNGCQNNHGCVDGECGKVSVTMRKRSHVFHSYDLLRFRQKNQETSAQKS